MSKSLLHFVFPPDVAGHRAGLLQQELVAFTESSNHLRDLQNKLRLVQRQASRLPPLNPLPPKVFDDRLSGTFTRTRKSYSVPTAPDRIRSEAYPIPNPPVHDFIMGQNSRHIGRDPQISYR